MVAVGLISLCRALTGDFDLCLVRSVRASIRGCEGGRFVLVVVFAVAGSDGGSLTTSGSS